MEILTHQYNLIRDGRIVFFDYCASLTPDHFLQNIPSFGDRSIRYLLVHVANTYEYWIGHFANIRPTPFAVPENFNSVSSIRSLFGEIDELMTRFIEQSIDRLEEPVINKVPSRDLQLQQTPLQLFTHVVTHEYHHKGQILSMSRELGYLPIDTDLIRF